MERLFERWTTNTRFRNVHRIEKRECVECVGCCALRHPVLTAFEDREGRAERHWGIQCGALIGEALDSLRRPV